ncbi:LppU/SCO3897 family protein [Actinocrispum wychmicini]
MNPEEPRVGDVLEVEIDRWEAARGTVKTIYLPATSGMRELTIRIPPGSPDNGLLRLSGQGSDGTDLFVRLRFRKGSTKPPVPGWFVASFVAILVGGIVVFTQSHSSSKTNSASSSDTSTYSSYTTDTSTSTYSYSYTPPTYRYTYSPPAPVVPETKVESAPEDSAGIGDCLRNDGTDTSPQMVKAPCGSGTFKILARKTGTTLGSACNGVARSTHDYVVEKYTVYTRYGVETSRIPNLLESYVLCLRRQ